MQVVALFVLDREYQEIRSNEITLFGVLESKQQEKNFSTKE